MEIFEYVLLLVLWEKVLTALQKASKKLQSIKTDRSVSKALLEMALSDLVTFLSSRDYILESAESLAKEWNIPWNFKESRKRGTKNFDEISSDESLEDPEKRFRVNVFYNVLGGAINQLKSRFERQSFVTDVFSFIFPRNLIELEDKELAPRVSKFLATYGSDIHEDPDVACDLESEIRQSNGHFFNDIRDMNGVEDILKKPYRTNLKTQFQDLGWRTKTDHIARRPGRTSQSHLGYVKQTYF